MIPDESLERGVELATDAVGGPSELARRLGDITPQAISQWRRVPTERIVDVERVSGVDREKLRPDLYRRRRKVVS